jgi:hypothetical protein
LIRLILIIHQVTFDIHFSDYLRKFVLVEGIKNKSITPSIRALPPDKRAGLYTFELASGVYRFDLEASEFFSFFARVIDVQAELQHLLVKKNDLFCGNSINQSNVIIFIFLQSFLILFPPFIANHFFEVFKISKG